MKTRFTISPIVSMLLIMGLLSSCATIHITKNEDPPVLAKLLQDEPSPYAFKVRHFHIRHVWGGNKGYPAATPYRAQITIWSEGGGAVAELYFHDAGQEMPDNPNPNNKSLQQPFQIHFPLSTLDAVLHELRSATEPVYLSYYDPANERQWAVGVLRGEDQQAYKRP